VGPKPVRRWGQFPCPKPGGVGLVLYFIGAVTTHIRARVLDSIGFPAAYLGLSIASLALAIAR